MKYTTRTLLVIALAIAVLIAGYRWWQWRSRWAGVRQELQQWADSIDRTDGRIEQYVKLNMNWDPNSGLTDSSSFSVLTGKPTKYERANGSFEWATDRDSKEDPSRFFVIPPGVWVDDIHAVIKRWDQHFSEGSLP